MSAESESRPVEWILQSLSPQQGVDREPILGADGLEIGRTASGLAFPDDLAMADRHAALEVSADGVTVRDLSDGEGIWVRVRGTQGQLLEDGDQVWLGSQILLVERSGEGWAVRHYGPEGRLRERHRLSEPGVLIGRGSALTLDVHDTRLSRRHAQLLIEGASLRLFDRGAHNGTYLKLRGQERLVEGDELRLGTQHFRLAARAVAAPESRPTPDAAPAPEAEGAPVARPVALRRGGLAARLRRMGRDLRPGEGPGFEPDRVGEDALERPPPPADPLPAGDEAGEVAIEEAQEATVVAASRSIPEPRSTPEPRPMPEPEPATHPEPEPVFASDGGSRDARTEAEETLWVEPSGAAEALMADDRIDPLESETLFTDSEEPDGEETRIVAPVGPAADTGPSGSARVQVVIESETGPVSLEIEPGRTLLEAVREAGWPRGEPIDWECGDGRCGVCIVGVMEGADRLDPPDPVSGEMKTIQITEQVTPDPTRYRLACLARVRGPVRLRKIT